MWFHISLPQSWSAQRSAADFQEQTKSGAPAAPKKTGARPYYLWIVAPQAVPALPRDTSHLRFANAILVPAHLYSVLRETLRCSAKDRFTFALRERARA